MNATQNTPPPVLSTCTKAELIEIAGQWIEKAQTKHREARHYRNQVERLEAELAALRRAKQ